MSVLRGIAAKSSGATTGVRTHYVGYPVQSGGRRRDRLGSGCHQCHAFGDFWPYHAFMRQITWRPTRGVGRDLLASARMTGVAGKGIAAGTSSPGVASALPPAWLLAALGPVLCLYQPHRGSELSGWLQATHAESHAGIDSNGLRESIDFFDREACCWRLHLLPDSDFLAWDRALESVPANGDGDTSGRLCQRLWRRMAGRLLGGQWQACVIRLHLLPVLSQSSTLAASPAPVSPLGLATAGRIASAEGAGERLHLDDRCARSQSGAAARMKAWQAGTAFG